MPHERNRHLLPYIKKQASFWPVVGIMGLRQVGKSTLLRHQLGLKNYLSLDDDDTRGDAEASSKAFLAKHGRPLVIDEVQKVPPLFDAVKSAVDRNRVPGSFYLTGSSAFSAQKNIHESLTGRIGICELYPLTLAEAHEKELAPKRTEKSTSPIHSRPIRFGIERLAAQLMRGGMPVPMFSRDESIRAQYWKNWVATTLGRDLPRVFGKGYDPDFAERILLQLVHFHEQGEFPSLSDFKYDSRKTRKYLNSLRAIFMVRMLPCHEAGVGRDIYCLTDSGMTYSLINRPLSESISLSLTRIYILNEIIANTQYGGEIVRWTYYKSRKGAPVDLVWNETPIKILNSIKQTGWEERAIHGAMKALNADRGLLVGPTDQIALPKKGKVGLVPWSYWS